MGESILICRSNDDPLPQYGEVNGGIQAPAATMGYVIFMVYNDGMPTGRQY